MMGALGGVIAGVLTGAGAWYPAVLFGTYGGSLGLLLGTSFAVAVTCLEERGSLGMLSSRRAALLGAVAGGVLPFLWLVFPQGELFTDLTALPTVQFLTALLAAGASCALLGASVAAGTVAVADRAPDQLGASADIDRLGSGAK